ncbi:hypothetical protein LQV05_001844 [Cryptococcus neoformans]|nr:hypothetical protein LQV05_001844 [Cryptococcus neoformans]
MSVVPKCDETGCTDSAIRVNSRCRFCKLSFCWSHFENETSHPCLTASHPETNRDGFEFEKDPEVSEILRHLDVHAIKHEVESIFPGHICNYVGKPQIWQELPRLCGNYNYHIVLGFADGQRWAMRIRLKQKKYLPPQALTASLKSEIATARALEDAGCAVPRTWERPKDSRLSESLTYFYQEFVPQGDCTIYTLWTEPFNQQTKIFIRNYAKFMIGLEKVRFNQMGSLTLTEDGDVTVGPFIEKRTTIDTPPYFLGPFLTAKEAYLAIIDRTVTLLGPIGGTGIDDTNCIRVTSGGAITGIIDWKWATLTSKGGAYAAPFCFPDDKYSEGLNALGVRELALIEAYRDLGRPELADLVRTGRKYHRLFDVLFRECVTLTTLNALRRAFLGLPDGKQGLPQTLKEWIQVAKQNYSTDEHLETMLERSEEFVKNSNQSAMYSEHWGLK